MIGDQKTKDDGYVSIATKVPTYVAELLAILAKMRGMEVYELLQLLVNGFITTAKADGPVSHDMRLLIESLKLDVAFNKAFSFANPTAQMDVAQVILVLQQHDSKQPRKGFGLCMIDKPFLPGEAPTMTLCVDDILERVAEVSMKGLYKELRQMGVAYHTDSLRETLTLMCDAQLIEHMNEEFEKEMPGYGEHHDYGKAIEYGKKFKRKPHRTPDSLANSQQQRIVFDDYDREVADMETEGWEGSHRNPENDEPPAGMPRPFDQEW